MILSNDDKKRSPKKAVKRLIIIVCILLIPILLFKGCQYIFTATLDYLADYVDNYEKIYDNYTKEVQRLCKDFNFEFADELEFLKGRFTYGGRLSHIYTFLFFMDGEMYETTWKNYIEDTNSEWKEAYPDYWYVYDEEMFGSFAAESEINYLGCYEQPYDDNTWALYERVDGSGCYVRFTHH